MIISKYTDGFGSRGSSAVFTAVAALLSKKANAPVMMRIPIVRGMDSDGGTQSAAVRWCAFIEVCGLGWDTIPTLTPGAPRRIPRSDLQLVLACARAGLQKGPSRNGETIDDTIVSERISGGPGLAGKWKTKNMKSTSPNVLEFSPSGADGLAFKIVDMGLACDARLDGKTIPAAARRSRRDGPSFS